MSKYRVILISFLIAIIGWTCGHNGDGHIMNWESSKAEDPQECFDVYLPKINQATLTYEQEYSKCIQTAETSIGAIESEISSDRADIYYEAEGVCALFQDCYDLDLSLHFFDCYYKATEEALESLYAIQNTTNNYMQFIHMKYEAISSEQMFCTTSCSDSYIRETYDLYTELDICLNGERSTSKSTTRTTSTTTEEVIPTKETTIEETTTSTTEVTETTTISAYPPVPPTLNPPSTSSSYPTPKQPEEETTTSTVPPPTPPTLYPPSTGATVPTPPNPGPK